MAAISGFTAGILLTGCDSSAKKVENAEIKVQDAKEKVAEAQMNLNNSRQDSITEYQKFRKEAEEKIFAHDKSIAEFKGRIASDERATRVDYEMKIAQLEKQNRDLKKMLDDYKEEGLEKWDAFKTKFNHNMDDLGKAFKAFTTNNF